jgi:hypothetical protein
MPSVDLETLALITAGGTALGALVGATAGGAVDLALARTVSQALGVGLVELLADYKAVRVEAILAQLGSNGVRRP